MKIKFLGTAAAEAIPAMYCDCETCRKARALGGKNIRTRSQTLIDDEMFIDYPCDTYYHVLVNNINLLDIKHCLITHIHEDHFYPDDFNWFEKGYSYPPQDWHGLTVYGSNDIEPWLEPRVQKSQGLLCCKPQLPFKPFKVGDYTVTALKANHGTENPYIYVIEKDGKTLLYANDTGLFPDETWEYLKSSGICFDAVSMDCNAGTSDINYTSHMGLPRNIKTRDMLIEYGLVNKNTKFILNHFSHNGGNVIYEEFSSIAEKYGFITTYDGFEIEIYEIFMSDCLFCKIVAGEIPSTKIYENESVYAFADIDPQAPFHAIIVPKEHIVSAADITTDNSHLIAKVFEAVAIIAQQEKLEKGFRVVNNCGNEGGQTVGHIHFHLLARRYLQWPPG